MSGKTIVALSFILFISFFATSQEIIFGSYEVKIRYLKGDYTEIKSAEEIIGTPFLDDQYKLGQLYFDGKDPINVYMRYNIVDEDIQVRIEDETFLVQDKINIKLDEVEWRKFEYQVKDSQYLSPGYFKVLTKNQGKDDLILLEKPLKYYKKGQKPAAMKTMSPAKYLDRSYFYFKFPDSKFPVFIDSKKKKFLEIFPVASREKIKAYIEQNNLRPKTQQELERVVSYYNGL